LTYSRYAALISAGLLAFSAVWWKLATDANAYILSVLLVLICAGTLLSSRPRSLLAGLALAGAMLVHELASLFYPAALVASLTSPNIEKKWPIAAKFSAFAWGITVAVYALCASLLHNADNPLAVIKWATSNQSGVSPSRNPRGGLVSLPRANLDMVVGHDFSFFQNHAGWVERFLALVASIMAIDFLVIFLKKASMFSLVNGVTTLNPRTREKWRACAPMLVTWIGAYAIFLLFWEPWQVLYRVYYLPPLALLFGLALSNYHRNTRASPTGASALAVSTLALFNLAFFIGLHIQAIANPVVAAARQASHTWNDRTVIYFADRNEADTAFEYFNDQTEWRKFTPAGLSSIDDEIRLSSSQGGQVWLNKGAAESVDRRWLALRARGREITIEEPKAPARYVELLSSQ
jgi:hypothetical protein